MIDFLSKMDGGQWFLIAMGVQYVVASGVFLLQRNPAIALTMLCYGIANGGLLWATAK